MVPRNSLSWITVVQAPAEMHVADDRIPGWDRDGRRTASTACMRGDLVGHVLGESVDPDGVEMGTEQSVSAVSAICYVALVGHPVSNSEPLKVLQTALGRNEFQGSVTLTSKKCRLRFSTNVKIT
jgi:hypothetical protein